MAGETLDYDILIRALFPKGAAWEPKSFEFGTQGGIELIINGTFDTDLTGWTNSSLTFGSIAWVATSGGSMEVRAAGLA
jgi:hypothetical protein